MWPIIFIALLVPCQWKPVEAVVTGYCAPCLICCGSLAPFTSTGLDVRERHSGFAVAPDLIAYGTRIYVPGYGEAKADDTGGAMRQDAKKGIVHVDCRFYKDHKTAKAFGRRVMTIYVETKGSQTATVASKSSHPRIAAERKPTAKVLAITAPNR